MDNFYNLSEETANEKLPDKPCIWHIDIESGKVKPLLKYTDFANFEPRPEMKGAEHAQEQEHIANNG